MGVQFPGKKRYVTLEWPLFYSLLPLFITQHSITVAQIGGYHLPIPMDPLSWNWVSTALHNWHPAALSLYFNGLIQTNKSSKKILNLQAHPFVWFLKWNLY